MNDEAVRVFEISHQESPKNFSLLIGSFTVALCQISMSEFDYYMVSTLNRRDETDRHRDWNLKGICE